jgi:hypothetical protein
MWLSRLRNLVRGPRRPPRPAPKPRRTRLPLEQLEDRSLPSTFSAATVSDLIADISAANQGGGSNTILLAANTTFDLTAVNNGTNGGNGLPVIAANNSLAITGQGGDVIQRDPSSYDDFRLFDVAGGASLTLTDLILQNGRVSGAVSGNSTADGGAIYNQGAVVLNAVTVQNNVVHGGFYDPNPAGGGIWSTGALTLENGTVVQGNRVSGDLGSGPHGTGQNAFGGGIWSSGSLTLETGTLVQGNQAVGGGGALNTSGQGGDAFGGGLYIAGGTASLTGAAVTNNSAVGGPGAMTRCGEFCFYTTGPGGDGFGGGLYAAGGATVTLCGDTVESNAASGGTGTKNGKGYGGGLFIAQKATFYLDSVTLANAINNAADKFANIDGSYVLQPC